MSYGKIHKCCMSNYKLIVFQRTAKEDFVALSLNKSIYMVDLRVQYRFGKQVL